MPTTDAAPSEQSTRDEILGLLKDGMDAVQTDIDAADPATTDEQRLQLRRYHELGYLANQYRKLQRDTDLDAMDDRLELLEEGLDA
ncbi:hypothetical protein DM867_05935 [Halosegnis rubeus]|uniref:DUF8136 domain-containing protein n=1 Tax=Halosegnis rubeus TaxID=2212850 RepID=A0A5N5U7Q7_9EURY|nr:MULTISPECIES: hypothetical protein [Halosegnis]KAB7514655.1 hypothetical protein DM867_05935 [Halosegnis rubeus]